MAMSDTYLAVEPSRDQLDRTTGPLLLEFGAPWCGHCIGAQDALRSAFVDYPGVGHIKIEDGKGRPLGRSFRVRLWPTLLFLLDGVEVDRLVRPTQPELIRERLEHLSRTCP
jgi:thioredoxin 1